MSRASNSETKRNTNYKDFIPAFHLNVIKSTMSSTASVLFNPLATRAVVKGDTVGLISELAPQILDQRRAQAYVNGKTRHSKEESKEIVIRENTPKIEESLLTLEIPESKAPLSLFQGFKATYPEYTSTNGRLKKKSKHYKQKNKGVLGSCGFSTPDSDTASVDNDYKPLNQLISDRDRVVRENDKLDTQKSRTLTEILKIESEIAELENKRKALSQTLARCEERKGELGQILEDLNNRIAHYGQESFPTSPKRMRDAKGTSSEFTLKKYNPGTCIKTLEGHNNVITCLDIDKSNERLVTASLDNTLRLWELTTYQCLGILDGHEDIVNCLQFSENLLFTGSKDRSIRQWDISKVPSLNTPKNTSNLISSSSSSSSRINGYRSNENLLNISDYEPETIGENSWIATLEGHSGEVTCLYYNDQYLLSGSSDKTMKQWDIQTSQCILTLDILWAMSSSRVSHNALFDGYWFDEGNFIAALQFWNYALASGTRDGAIRLWDLRTGQAHRTLLGHTGPITCLQFDELQIVSGSLDKSIRIWDLRTGSVFDTLHYEQGISDLQFDLHKIICAAGEEEIKVYNRTSLQHSGFKGHSEPVQCVKYNNSILASGGRDSLLLLSSEEELKMNNSLWLNNTDNLHTLSNITPNTTH
ncbi:hypothetical protein G9A89_020709 [Geosiphon pyriformis]|nr:hypothetical protein G9A89_020709 [Geosiphon pyriformis]